MGWSLFLTRRAEKDLRRLSEEDAGRIIEVLERLASDGHGDVRRRMPGSSSWIRTLPRCFPDSDSVNRALRAIAEIIKNRERRSA